MTRALSARLEPFVDALPTPSRLIAAEHDGRLTVRMRAGAHRFHRDLPASTIWGYDGTVPGPTIEAERGQPVTIEWRNELQGGLPRLRDGRPRGDRRRRRARAMPPRPERRRAGPPRGRVDRPDSRPPPRRPHARLIRRLGREHLRPGPARRLPLPDG